MFSLQDKICSVIDLLHGYIDLFFFFQAEDGIRDIGVTGVQTCALPIYAKRHRCYAVFTRHERELEREKHQRVPDPHRMASHSLVEQAGRMVGRSAEGDRKSVV